ncbi:hypothetical protein BIY29_18755 [Brenneria alni]|uniref:Sugar kinase n=1 Tax=Brenneria alni TaxID=71656 RepID=A0A421DIZ3_9GAMM|nr:nucleoside 2-deoxyribosyltransferase [Brenneria alni]RLM18005.1 hypothetical protein BIY29_18755 [Brenneria alni]
MKKPILLIGEVYIDFTINTNHKEPKMRLGGITHAARGLWASNIPYAVAAICPSYIIDLLKDYLLKHNCSDFHLIGEIKNSPNLILISDVKEVGHQGYEDILREEKKINILDISSDLKNYERAIIFPGKYALHDILNILPQKTTISVDIAYGVKSFDELSNIKQHIDLISISTSSDLFREIILNGIQRLLSEVSKLKADFFLLKENRGGSHVYNLRTSAMEEIPAYLYKTINSVGVGDVYTSVMAAKSLELNIDSAWRGLQAATCYAQTTFPDDLKRNLERDYNIPIESLKIMKGTSLPWLTRKDYKIYLAAPDFSYIEKKEIEEAISSLEYHNFNVKRPIIENGEIERPAENHILKDMYQKDIKLLNDCDIVLAIPLERDPGTLVEIGHALSSGIPVVTYDPRKENDNTMIMGGCDAYTDCLDIALNHIFMILSKIRKGEKN